MDAPATLTPEEQQDLYDYLVKNDFRYFISAVFHELNPATEYDHNWHIEHLAYLLARTMPPPLNPEPNSPRLRRLIINVPPRTLKSLIVNVAYRCFILGHFPHEKILSASYSADLSEGFNNESIKVINSEWYQRIFPNTKLTKQTGREFHTSTAGKSFATSTGSVTTGKGGNILIGDDLISSTQAASPTELATCNYWIENAFLNRMDDVKHGGVIIIVMQRLHEIDPTGFLLEQNANLPDALKWLLIKHPLIAEEEETYNFYGQSYTRKIGDPLNPLRDGPDRIKAAYVQFGGASGFAAQCQQSPTPKGGGLLKPDSIQTHQHPPLTALTQEYAKTHKLTFYQSWDTAIKDTAAADWSVCTTWAVSSSQMALIDIYRAKLDYPALKAAVSSQAAKLPIPPAAILIEDKASGQQLIQEFKQNTLLPIYPVKAYGTDRKLVVASAMSLPIELGQFTIPVHQVPPNPSHWYLDFYNEFVRFPKGKHDDIVDSCSQFIQFMLANNFQKFRIRIV